MTVLSAAVIVQSAVAAVIWSDDFTAPDGTTMASRGYSEIWNSGGAIYNNQFEAPPGTDAAYYEQLTVTSPAAGSSWNFSVNMIIKDSVPDCANNGIQLRGNSADPRWAEIVFMDDGGGTGHWDVHTWDSSGVMNADSILYGSSMGLYTTEIEIDVENLRFRGLVNGTAGSWRSIAAVDLPNMNKAVLAMDARSSQTGAAYDYLLIEGEGERIDPRGWQPHVIREGDGNGGYIYRGARIQSVPANGNYVMSFGMAEMDNGELVLLGSRSDVSGERPSLNFSSDGGNTWSGFQDVAGVMGRPSMLTDLGGGNLSMAVGATRYFSSDYGQTWPESAPIPPIPGGMTFYIEGNAAVDRDAKGNATKVMELGWNYESSHGSWPTGDGSVFFRYSTDGGRTWQGEVTPSEWKFDVEYNGQTYTRGVSEGSVVRAANGDLVAALRLDMLPVYYSIGDDSCEGTAISISHDDGLTWSEMDHIFYAGRHHGNLQLMPNGDLVLTMINRHDIRTGIYPDTDMIGCDALVSHDNGVTWEPSRLITLDEFANPVTFPHTKTGHIGAIALSDGMMISAYSDYVNGTVELIKWSPTAMPGDATGDGVVDEDDAVVLAENWLGTGEWYQGDFNDDGIINDEDAAILAANYGRTIVPSSVPEPTVLFQLLCLLLFFCAKCHHHID